MLTPFSFLTWGHWTDQVTARRLAHELHHAYLFWIVSQVQRMGVGQDQFWMDARVKQLYMNHADTHTSRILSNFGVSPHLQYVQWAGVGQDQFWTDARVKQLYMNHVRTLANRRNVYTGLLYKNDPAIFSWNL